MNIMNILKAPWRLLCAIGRFLDSPEEPTKKSERTNDILLGVVCVLVLAAVFIGNGLLKAGPAAFGG